MPKLQNEKQLARFDYDFSVLGGAVGAINLTPNITALAAGMVITDMYIFVEEALISAASGHTVTLGNTDVDGFFADINAAATADNDVLRVGEVAGALLWDDTNDHHILYRVGADVLMDMTVGVEALTGGKLQVYVEFIAPFNF